MKRSVIAWLCPLLLLTMIALSGCSAKTAATPEQFQKAAGDAGFTVEEKQYSDSYNAYEGSKGDMNIGFYVCDTEAGAKTFYTNVKSYAPNTDAVEHVDSSFYSKYVYVKGDRYCIYVRMGKTLLVADGPTSEQADVEQVVKALKY